MKQSKLLTVAFVVITLLVSGAIIWQACNFVDSLHKNVKATADIHIPGDTKTFERSKFDPVASQFSKQIDSMSSTQVFREKPKAENLQGSEKNYEKALVASHDQKYSEAILDLSAVLSAVPSEEKTKTSKAWWADGKFRDKRMYQAMAYELRGYCYLQLAQYKRAIQDLDVAIGLRPLYATNYVNRGKAHNLLGEKALGMADLSKARTLPVVGEPSATEHTLDDLAR